MLASVAIQAHNGALAYAHAVENITVDADLSDWPLHAKRHSIRYYQDGYLPKDSTDTGGYFMMGYNIETQSLYVGVEFFDNSYIRNEENPEWWAHDMQVLYLDPRHTSDPNGVLALEVNEYLRKIVGQEQHWDPLIKGYGWEQVDVKVIQNKNSTIYEWKINLPGYIEAGRVLGFDYVVFDKDDPEKDTRTVGWGQDNGIKHQCSPCLGDVMLLKEDTSLAELSGMIQIQDSLPRPRTLGLQSMTDESFRVNSHIDSTGSFKAVIPQGRYRISGNTGLFWKDDKVYRVIFKGEPEVMLSHKNPLVYNNPVLMELLPPPDLIPVKGFLHEPKAEAFKAVDSFVKSYMDYYGIPGVSLALIKEGKLLYQSAYGVQNSILGTSLTTENLFEAASITKPVFSYVVLRLAEQKTLDLDKPLHEYLPFDELETKYPEYRKMTARHVLTHKSGLPNWGRELLRPPGTEYGYSGEGFEYLKRVVAKITGREIEDVVKEELIRPLNLTHMEFSDSPYLRTVAATGHFDELPTIQPLPEAAGMAWSMYTEAGAFTDFALALLYRKGLNPETYEEMMTIHSEFPEDDRDKTKGKQGMGIGIGLAESDWGRIFFHGGNNGDFRCQFTVYEDLKMGFAVFTNANTGRFLADDLGRFLVEGRGPID
jgi:CubicO group peptidase (beta-lactamase class C family)